MNLQTAWVRHSLTLAMIVLLSASVQAETPTAEPAVGVNQQLPPGPRPTPLPSGPASFGDLPAHMIPPAGFSQGIAPPQQAPYPPSGFVPGQMPLGPQGGLQMGVPPMGMPPMGMPPMGMPPQGVSPAGYAGPMGPPQMGPQMQGGPGMQIAPASYAAPGPMSGPTGPVQTPYCQACGGSGCEYCSGYGVNGHINFTHFFRYLLPYSEGGCCSQRWYDVHADFMYLTREDMGRGDTIFMSNGNRGNGPPVAALSTSDLDFDEEGAPRLSIAFQLGAGSSIEATYFGFANFAAQSSINDSAPFLPDNFYSIFSDFGQNPPPNVAVNPPLNGGNFFSDAAEFASIDYSSEIQSVEMMFRRRWVGTNCKVQGSWSAGVRYFQLFEELGHQIRVDYTTPALPAVPAVPDRNVQGSTNYQVATRNALTGFQMGTDIWACVVPGVKIGGEAKAGVYGNHSKQVTTYNFDTVLPVPANISGTEEVRDAADVALVGEAGIIATWRVNYHWTLRVGYQGIYVDGVALATENFNPVLPGVNRVAFLNDNGSMFLHGATGGIEYIW